MAAERNDTTRAYVEPVITADSVTLRGMVLAAIDGNNASNPFGHHRRWHHDLGNPDRRMRQGGTPSGVDCAIDRRPGGLYA